MWNCHVSRKQPSSWLSEWLHQNSQLTLQLRSLTVLLLGKTYWQSLYLNTLSAGKQETVWSWPPFNSITSHLPEIDYLELNLCTLLFQYPMHQSWQAGLASGADFTWLQLYQFPTRYSYPEGLHYATWLSWVGGGENPGSIDLNKGRSLPLEFHINRRMNHLPEAPDLLFPTQCCKIEQHHEIV